MWKIGQRGLIAVPASWPWRIGSKLRTGYLRRRSPVAALALTLITVLPAAALGILDQQQTKIETGGTIYQFCNDDLGPNPSHIDRPLAQTFTAGISGPLDAVAVRVLAQSFHSAPGDLTVQIRATDANGVPSTTVLASTAAPASNFLTRDSSGLISERMISFAVPATVTAGQKYALILLASTTHCFVAGEIAPGIPIRVAGADYISEHGFGPDDYPLGEVPSSFDGVTWTPAPLSSDLYFKTYVTHAPYAFGGFQQPIANGVPNSANAGQTIPVEWRLTDVSGAPVSDPRSFVSLTSSPTSSACGSTADAIEASSGNSGLRYLGDGNWQFNWKTPKEYAGQCRTMALNLSDGTTHIATFVFKEKGRP